MFTFRAPFNSTLVMLSRVFKATCNLNVSLSRHASSSSTLAKIIAEQDPQQVTLLDEPCIVVDQNDKVLGSRSKKDCHLLINNSRGILHRAFSVFLFNSEGSLLLQRRSSAKITYPGHFSNTCCSHPLFTTDELEEHDALGVKRAAQRRLEFELGIPKNEVPLEKLDYITRIHYFAAADAPWGEHEIDHILFLKADVTVKENLNEVSELRYIRKDELTSFTNSLTDNGIPITPWFQMIINTFLPYWWENLDNTKVLKDFNTIHRL